MTTIQWRRLPLVAEDGETEVGVVDVAVVVLVDFEIQEVEEEEEEERWKRLLLLLSVTKEEGLLFLFFFFECVVVLMVMGKELDVVVRVL